MSQRISWIPSSLCLLTCMLLSGETAVPSSDPKPSSEAPKKFRRPKKIPPAEARVEVEGVAPPVLQETRLDPLAQVVTIVSSEQIEDLQAQDLPSALRQTPGIVVSRHNPVGSFGGGEGGSVFIRGMGSSRPGAEIQFLMDGVPRVVGVWTHPLMDVLSVDVMDRMEVYKGPQPVLLGHSAFGAVAITTKSMADEGMITGLDLAGGSYGTGVEVLQHGARKGAFDYYLVQSFRKSNGHRDFSGGQLKNYFGRMGWVLSPQWKTSLVVNGTDNWAEDPGVAEGKSPRQGRFKTKDLFAVFTLAHEHAWGQGHLKLYRENGHIRWAGQYNSSTKQNNVDTNTDYDNYGIRMMESLSPWNGGNLLLGADLDFIGGEVENLAPPAAPNRFEKSTFRVLAPYLALSHTFGSQATWHFTPSAGVRFLEHSEFGRATGTQAGLILGFGSTEFHASMARGLNYPGIYVKAQDQMFMPGDNQWKKLKPEIIDHMEVGFSQTLGTRAKLELNLFQDEGKDRIVVAPPPPMPALFTNFGSWKTEGLECSATWTFSRELAFFAGGTYLHKSPQDLPYAPRKSASLGMNVRFGERFQLTMDGLYVDGQFVASRARTQNTVNKDWVGAYALMNAKLSWEFGSRVNWMGQGFISLENLGNRKYEQKKAYPMPGTNGLAGIKLRF